MGTGIFAEWAIQVLPTDDEKWEIFELNKFVKNSPQQELLTMVDRRLRHE